MQSQQQQQRYSQPRFRPQQGGSGASIPRQQQPHVSVGQVPQQQQQQVVHVQAQQIPQQQPRGAQQPQLTPPSYGGYAAPIHILQYSQGSQGMGVTTVPQYRIAYAAQPGTYYQPAPVVPFNHIQQWQLSQNQHQLQQVQAAQHYYQQGGVVQAVPQLIHPQVHAPTFYMRGAGHQQQSNFIAGPPLQQQTSVAGQQPVQPQQSHQAHHVQQHAPQPHGVPNVGMVPVPGTTQVQQQPEARENSQPPPQRPRKKLDIVNPDTGKSVFEETNDDVSAVTGGLDSAQAEGTSNDEPETVSLNSASTPSIVSPPQASPAEDASRPGDEKGLNAARLEFYQKIAQIDEVTPAAGRGGPNGDNSVQQTTSSTTASSTTSPPSSSPVTEVLEAPVKETEGDEGTGDESVQEEDKAVHVIEEPQDLPESSFNGTGDSVQEASICSVSPTPLEKYLSPGKSVPDGLSTQDGNLTELRMATKAPPLGSGSENEEATVAVNAQSVLESNDTGITSPSNAVTEETQDKGAMESSMEGSLSEIIQNGDEGDHNSENEEDNDETEEGEINEIEDSTGPTTKPTRIRYDREQLLNFKQSKDSQIDIQSAIPADLFKDPKSSSSNISFNPRASSGGIPHMGMRGMGGMRRGDNRGMMGMQQGRMGQWSPMGQMGAGGPFQVPPPFQAPPKPPKVIELQKEPVKLHKAESAWKPSTVGRNKGPAGEEKDENQLIIQDVVKKTRGILNKLTPENFEKLVNKFMQLQLDDKDDRIAAVIHVVFEKAVDEPNFSTAYAKMVKTVCDKSPETAKKFRKQILDQCQKEFQKGTRDEEDIRKLEGDLEAAEEDKKAEIKLEIEEKRFSSRRRALGNVRFIGELYKLQMLTPKIMVECVNMLLADQDEEKYECLCKLLTTVGQRLEDHLKEAEARAADCVKKGIPPKFQPDEKFMDKTFAKLKALSQNNKLSSRIRFALLDVYELRENNYKPRRDAAGPKTIEEVRRDAVLQEQEEKRKIQSLPPAAPLGRPQSMQLKKGSEWNTVQSNKSSRFQQQQQVRKSGIGEPSTPLLGPQGGPLLWTRGAMTQGPPSKPQPNLPPRMLNNNNKYAPLQAESRTPFREDIVKPPPPPIRTTPSAPLSGSSSRESSRPQTPTRDVPAPYRDQEPKDLPLELTKEERQIVKNILEEFVSFRKWDDTLDWIQSRFKGQRIYSFIDELSRLVSELSNEEQQKTAGSLINTLIKKQLVNKNKVIKTIQDGVITELPDIEYDAPKATSYLAVFFVELFIEESDLSWLLQFEDNFQDFPETWSRLVSSTLNILKLWRNEDYVQSIFKKTNGANRFPIEGIPWVQGETLESLSMKMIKVLQEEIAKSSNIDFCAETWDLRDELTNRSLMHALCSVSWQEADWNIPLLEKFFRQTNFPADPDHIPLLWQQAREFITSNNIDKESENKLWSLMNSLDLISADSAKSTA